MKVESRAAKSEWGAHGPSFSLALDSTVKPWLGVRREFWPGLSLLRQLPWHQSLCLGGWQKGTDSPDLPSSPGQKAHWRTGMASPAENPYQHHLITRKKMDICFIIVHIIEKSCSENTLNCQCLDWWTAFVPLISCRSGKNVSLPLKMWRLNF